MSGDEIFSGAIGFVLGGAVMILWVSLGRRFGEDRFWPAFQHLARDLAAGAPPDQILRQYADLLKLLALYVGKMTCRVGIAILPVVLCCTLLAPLVFERTLRSARRVLVYPAQSVHVTVGNDSLTFGTAGLAELPRGLPGRIPLRIVTPAAEVSVPAWTAPIALSRCAWKCAGLQLLGLEAHHAAAGPPLLIVRPDVGDGNPLFPFLSDMEFSFWAGLVGSSLLVGLTRMGMDPRGASS